MSHLHIYMWGLLLLELIRCHLTLPSELAFWFCGQNILFVAPTGNPKNCNLCSSQSLSSFSFVFLLITLHHSPQVLAVTFKIRYRLVIPNQLHCSFLFHTIQWPAPVHSEQASGIWRFKIMYFLIKYGETAFYSEKLLLGRGQGKVPGATLRFPVGLKVKAMLQKPSLNFSNHK